jgi:SAM-dependent methyltransferase
MSAFDTSTGSATRWGPLWGSRAEDWAAVEEQQLPTYLEAIRRIGISAGERVLEVGCGSGVFLRAAADLGADVAGLDASEQLIEIARRRAPDADLRVGDMEALPWTDATFDLVAGFNSFFFADDMVGALREAGRVAKTGALVVIQVWGAHERCDLEAMKRLTRSFLPPRPPDAPPDPDLSQPGVLADLVAKAGLEAIAEFDTTWAYDFADAESLGRALASVAGLAVLVGPDRELELKATIVEGMAPYRRADGSYRLSNEYHYLVARAAV